MSGACSGAGAQEAAGAFAFLRDEASMKMDSPRPHDVAPETAAMLERLMLAQVPRVSAEQAAMKQRSFLAPSAQRMLWSHRLRGCSLWSGLRFWASSDSSLGARRNDGSRS